MKFDKTTAQAIDHHFIVSFKRKEHSVYMKQPSPALAPLLRSDAQGDLLAYLLLQPERESTLSEIARQIDAQLTTVHREVDRLVTSGLLTERRIGTARLIRANVEDRLYLPMRSLLEATYGPKVVLESVLAGHPDVESAFTFGSWGARYSGKQGASPNDLDVLIVGTLSRRDTYPLAQQVEDLLQMEVNAEKVDATQWIDGTDAFVAGLKSRPLVQLKLEMDLK